MNPALIKIRATLAWVSIELAVGIRIHEVCVEGQVVITSKYNLVRMRLRSEPIQLYLDLGECPELREVSSVKKKVPNWQ